MAARRLITVKSDIGATSAPWPADAPSTAVTSGTRPEHRAWASRSVGVRAPCRPSARKPAPSSIITSGTRSSTASSATRYRLPLADWLIVPALTVKSSAATITGRPSTVPEPITTASAGASSPPTSVPSSRNEPGIEQVVDAGPGVELPRPPVLGQPLVATHGARRAPAVGQVVEDLVPPLVGVRPVHAHRPSNCGVRRST